MTILDASVVIALLDERDALHDAAQRALASAEDERLVLPTSAFAEVMLGAYRRGQAVDVRRVLQDLGIKPEPLTEEMADAAARLRARHASLRFADALILGTAQVLDADAVLTGDRSRVAWSGRVDVLG